MSMAESLGWIVIFLIVLVVSSLLSLVVLLIMLSQVFIVRKSVVDGNAWMAEILDVIRWMSGLDSTGAPVAETAPMAPGDGADVADQPVDRAPNLHPDVVESSRARHPTHRR